MGESGQSAGPSRRHHHWHRSLLRELPSHGSSRARVDGVVVPTHRTADNLAFAVSVARDFGCPLLAVSGGASRTDDVLDVAKDVRCYVVRDTDVLALERLPSAVAQAHASSRKQRNIAAGRNVGLLVARLAGWRTVLFIDDDVDADPQERFLLDRAVARFHEARVDAAGWIQRWFPDNSVVCHANRLAGNPQSCFVSTGALTVAVSGTTALFPPVYNEDWLFLFDSLARRRVAFGGYVRQQPYDPYADPARAADEEFGDLVAEGLFHLLHAERPAQVDAALRSTMSAEAFWTFELEFRASFLAGLASQLSDGAVPEKDVMHVPAALASVRAAEERLARITAGDVVAFVDAWREDLRTWGETMSRLHPIGTLPAAFDVLHVPYATTALD